MQKNARNVIKAINFLHLLHNKCNKFLTFIVIFCFYRFMREIFLICKKCDMREMNNVRFFVRREILFITTNCSARNARNSRNAIIIAHAYSVCILSICGFCYIITKTPTAVLEKIECQNCTT